MGRSGNKKSSKITSKTRNIVLGGSGSIQKTAVDNYFFKNQSELIALLEGRDLWSLEEFKNKIAAFRPNFRDSPKIKNKLKNDPVIKEWMKLNATKMIDIFAGQEDFSGEEAVNYLNTEMERFMTEERESLPSLFEIPLKNVHQVYESFEEIRDLANSLISESIKNKDFRNFANWYFSSIKETRFDGSSYYFDSFDDLPAPGEVDLLAISFKELSSGLDAESANQLIFKRVSNNDPGYYPSILMPEQYLNKILAEKHWRQTAGEITMNYTEDPINIVEQCVNEDSNHSIATHVLSLIEGSHDRDRDNTPIMVRGAELFAIDQSPALFLGIEKLVSTDLERSLFEKARKDGLFSPDKSLTGHADFVQAILESSRSARQRDGFPIVEELINSIRSITF